MRNKKILIIDDDRDLSLITKEILSSYGYEVMCAYNSEEAYEILTNSKFHLLLLDINLPNELGFDFCTQIRKLSSVPIIFISARTSEDDKIVALDIGGDDYISKPYSLKELLSRVNSLMRRSYGFVNNDVIKVCNIEINPSLRTVKKDNVEVSLSLKEFDLLLFLAMNINVSLNKETILNQVWGAFNEVEISTVAVHIRWLREKLEENPANPKLIKTVWGIGYCLVNGEN